MDEEELLELLKLELLELEEELEDELLLVGEKGSSRSPPQPYRLNKLKSTSNRKARLLWVWYITIYSPLTN